MKILLVDDEPFVLKQLEYLIGEFHPQWETFSCVDSIQALQVLNQHNIQLAILDIELPGKDGLTLAKEMKKSFSQVNIVMLSAYQDFRYAKTSIRIGVDDYLTKPIIEEELKEVLGRYVQQYNFSTVVLDTLNYIHQNYHERINLSLISEQIHINPSYLSRKFHDETGKKFSDYVLDYRIEKSKEKILNNRTESISSIADQCGFNSLHYFSKTFKQKVGQTPKEFREEGIKADE
ncbi:response regulator transcription factor [Salinibacillus xinjiangensis]|uniref:Response regulator n=1 Tax=Salinibacillus xinjiangensis TaxID=1229268 RepID=A0A6G1XAB3_9BACI|nr:response regulator [Salinibacillus xinjiangensis]MRG87882.1 response regulator [Salinibacillus xinjiangensis]